MTPKKKERGAKSSSFSTPPHMRFIHTKLWELYHNSFGMSMNRNCLKEILRAGLVNGIIMD